MDQKTSKKRGLVMLVLLSSSSSSILEMLLRSLVSLQGLGVARIAITELAGVLLALW
jgi:hypothetical protein